MDRQDSSWVGKPIEAIFLNFILSYKSRRLTGGRDVVREDDAFLGFVNYNPDGTQAQLVGIPVKHEIPLEGDLVISGYADSHDTKSLRIVTGKNELILGDHVPSPNVSFHHSPKIAGARLRYISQSRHETKNAVVFKFHWEVAQEEVTEEPASEAGITSLFKQLKDGGRKQKEVEQDVLATPKHVKELVNKVRGNKMDKKEADRWLAQWSHFNLVDRVDWTEVSGWKDSGFIHVLENLHLVEALLKWHAAESREKNYAEEEVRRCIRRGGVTAYVRTDEEEDKKKTFNQAKDAWNELHSPKCRFFHQHFVRFDI